MKMKISEKTLELNVGAELLNHLRTKCGWRKMYLRGLTQQQESQDGVDIFAELSPRVRIAAFQFKAPRGKEDHIPYKFRIQKQQHLNLQKLANIEKNSVFYVLPFYASHDKLCKHLPTLLQDTWFLPVDAMKTDDVFGNDKSRTVHCHPGYATINPEFALSAVQELDLRENAGVELQDFVNWYRESLSLIDEDRDLVTIGRQRKNPWLFRGLKVAIIETEQTKHSLEPNDHV